MLTKLDERCSEMLTFASKIIRRSTLGFFRTGSNVVGGGVGCLGFVFGAPMLVHSAASAKAQRTSAHNRKLQPSLGCLLAQIRFRLLERGVFRFSATIAWNRC